MISLLAIPIILSIIFVYLYWKNSSSGIFVKILASICVILVVFGLFIYTVVKSNTSDEKAKGNSISP